MSKFDVRDELVQSSNEDCGTCDKVLLYGHQLQALSWMFVLKELGLLEPDQ